MTVAARNEVLSTVHSFRKYADFRKTTAFSVSPRPIVLNDLRFFQRIRKSVAVIIIEKKDTAINRVVESGGGEIRTHGDPKATPVFKTGAFNRSATPPAVPNERVQPTPIMLSLLFMTTWWRYRPPRRGFVMST